MSEPIIRIRNLYRLDISRLDDAHERDGACRVLLVMPHKAQQLGIILAGIEEGRVELTGQGHQLADVLLARPTLAHRDIALDE